MFDGWWSRNFILNDNLDINLLMKVRKQNYIETKIQHHIEISELIFDMKNEDRVAMSNQFFEFVL